MALKIIICCVSTVLLQSISAQCISNTYNGIYGNGRTIGVENAAIGNVYGTGRILGIENAATGNIYGTGRALGIEKVATGNICGTGRALGIENAAIGNMYRPATGIYGNANGLAQETYGGGLTLASLASTNRGGVAVSSVSPMAPNGIRVQTENMLIEGPLAVNGKLPFLGAISMDGALPANGLGNVAYRCAGNSGITNENYPAPVAQGYNALGPVSYSANIASSAPVAQGYKALSPVSYSANIASSAPVAQGYNALGPVSYSANIASPAYYNAQISGRRGSIL